MRSLNGSNYNQIHVAKYSKVNISIFRSGYGSPIEYSCYIMLKDSVTNLR